MSYRIHGSPSKPFPATPFQPYARRGPDLRKRTPPPPLLKVDGPRPDSWRKTECRAVQRELRLNIRPARIRILTLPIANRSCCLPELSLPLCKMEVGRLIHLGAVRTYPVVCFHAVLGTSPCVSAARYRWSCLWSGAPVFLLVHPSEPGPGLLAAEPLISCLNQGTGVDTRVPSASP